MGQSSSARVLPGDWPNTCRVVPARRRGQNQDRVYSKAGRDTWQPAISSREHLGFPGCDSRKPDCECALFTSFAAVKSHSYIDSRTRAAPTRHSETGFVKMLRSEQTELL